MQASKPRPSATRLNPIISNRPRHRITTVGWRATKAISGRLATIITIIATTTAVIMMLRSCTMSTAVITESSENTASSATICTITCQNAAYCVRPPPPACALPSTRSCSSMVPLNSRNSPPRMRIRSRPDICAPHTVNSGAVSVTTQAMLASRPSRISKASVRPIMRARLRWCAGSLSARMAMNTRLSMPSTISSTIRVASPSQAVGSVIHSNGIGIPCG
ncbi:Uncharacterised protein [Bordetella pertussis]|nr:Uncharacterised protein [Bordetella pertussis]